MSQMLPPDIAAALGGGGGAPPDQGGGGLPPDIMAALQGGGGQAPPDQSMSQDGSPGGGGDALSVAIDALHQALVDEADEQDKAIITKCLAQLQQVLANNQKDADSMLQGKSTPAGVRKAAAGAQQAGAY